MVEMAEKEILNSFPQWNYENMDPSGGVMVWGMFSWRTLGPLVTIWHRLNAMAYLSIVSIPLWPPSSDDYFQQDNAPCHKVE